MRYFNKDAPIIRFAMPDTKLTVSGICTLSISAVSEIFKLLICEMPFTNEQLKSIAERLAGLLNKASIILLAIGVILIATAIIVHLKMPDKARIKYLVRKGLYCYEYGNPLHLKDGEKLPEIKQNAENAKKTHQELVNLEPEREKLSAEISKLNSSLPEYDELENKNKEQQD